MLTMHTACHGRRLFVMCDRHSMAWHGIAWHGIARVSTMSCMYVFINAHTCACVNEPSLVPPPLHLRLVAHVVVMCVL